MNLVIGLGNPGRKYINSRHNLGFMVVKELAKELGAKFRYSIRANTDIAKKKYQNRNILLGLPQTFMNNSGRAVSNIIKRKKIPLKNVLVVYDDLDLDFGSIRMRKKGSSGGHKGIKSLINELATQDFARIKIGIGRPNPKVDSVDYVLSNFNSEEKKELPCVVNKAVQACICWLDEGIDSTISKFN